MISPRTIIFDLDGTLYEDDAIFDVYARELAAFVPPDRREAFLTDWEVAKAGRGVATIGLGYEEDTDRLFHFEDNRITGYLDWNGTLSEVLPHARAADAATATDESVPVGPAAGSIFGQGRFNIGDLWWLPAALASHYGVTSEQRQRAFLATRRFMGTRDYRLTPIPGVAEMLHHLQAAGRVLIAMSNSPQDTTEDVLRQLGLYDRFDQIRPFADKPAGLTAFLQRADLAWPVLSAGDNYVNDIAPCLAAGGDALFIDRHQTKLGAGNPRCYRVASAREMVQWLERMER